MDRRNNFHRRNDRNFAETNSYYNNKNYRGIRSGRGTSRQFPSNRSQSIKYINDNRNNKFTSNLPIAKEQYNLQVPKYIPNNTYRENQNSFNSMSDNINHHSSSSTLIKPSYVSTYVRHNCVHDNNNISKLFKIDSDSKHNSNQSMHSCEYKLQSTKPVNMFLNNSSQSINTFQYLVNDRNEISDKSNKTQSKYTCFNFGGTKSIEELTSQVNFKFQSNDLPNGNLVQHEKCKIGTNVGIFQSVQSLFENSNIIKLVNDHSHFIETLNKDSKSNETSNIDSVSKSGLISCQSTFDSWVKQTYGESNSLFWNNIVTLTPATWKLSMSTPLFKSTAASASNSAVSINIKNNDKNPSFTHPSNSFPLKDNDLSIPVQSPPISDDHEEFIKSLKVDQCESSLIGLSNQSSTKLELDIPVSINKVPSEATIQLTTEQETTIPSGRRIILKRVRRMR